MEYVDLLISSLGKNSLLLNEPMKNHTSFKIGGNADVVFLPRSTNEIIKCVKICKENNVPFFVLGLGSNVLVSDKGIRGVVIKIGTKTTDENYDGKISIINDTDIKIDASLKLSEFAKFAYEFCLTGAEFAGDIPGSVGGAIYMNAGAYEGEISQIIKTVDVILDGEIVTFTKEELDFGYRKCLIQKNNGIIVSAVFSLTKSKKSDIILKQQEFREKRNSKQPKLEEFPSAGSTFKRPEGFFAGKLIMDSGLRGFKIGGALVSEKHCGFVVSDGTATCSDVKNLIEHVQKTVFEKFGVKMETEVKFIGE